MKAIMVMFDSLNRHLLPPYGCDWIKAPNFARLAERTVTFERSCIGSMPCMPARRELHTGRYNFLHRSWGPLEPFDDSMPELLKQNGVHTHLATDHQHYWEDGGCTYHTRYSTWDFSRGQEGDPWKANLTDAVLTPATLPRKNKGVDVERYWVNRFYMPEERDQPRTFANGLEFLDTNHAENNWFLQIETFDPHEPFFTQQHFKDLYPHEYDGLHFDWPPYDRVREDEVTQQHMRYEYASLVSMCDKYLGKVLDKMDVYELWDDTLLIVCADHGFLLGEHDWWAKCRQPFFQEIAHTPLFIWDPRCGRQGERCNALVQTIDWAPTLLDYFGLDIPADMMGHPLRDAIAADNPVREAGLFGIFGGHVSVIDDRYVYMRAPVQSENAPLFEYTLMPTHMHERFAPEELSEEVELAAPFSFTKDCKLLKINANRRYVQADWHAFGSALYDIEADPQQLTPLADQAIEARMSKLLTQLMHAADAPTEQFERLGLAVSI